MSKQMVTTPRYTGVIGNSIQELLKQHSTAVGESDERLASFIESALKTLVITRSVWGDEVDKAALMDVARGIFPDAHQFRAISELVPRQVQVRLTELEMPHSPAFDRDLLRGSLVLDAKDQTLGIFVETPFSAGEPPRNLWWFIANDGQILQVVDDLTLNRDGDFADVIGTPPASTLANCASLADLAALELSTIARSHSVRAL